MAAPEYFEWMDRGRAHQREGRPIDAMLCYHRAARIDPTASDPHFALGETHWQLGRLPDAITAWREASRITHNHMAPVQAEAEALLAIGDTEGAVTAAKRVQALMPQDARAALIRGIGALAQGDPADRFLIATARTHGLVLATRDERILEYAKSGFLRVVRM